MDSNKAYNTEKNSYYYDSPIGRIFIAESGGAITDVGFHPIEGSNKKETPLIKQTTVMLQEYFDGKRKDFNLPLSPKGTDFQKKAWAALCSIPYGQTRSYKEQAIAVGNEKACRAVGGANGKNPISIIIPCHRVIGTGNKLTGYGGGLAIKKALLELESRGACHI